MEGGISPTGLVVDGIACLHRLDWVYMACWYSCWTCCISMALEPSELTLLPHAVLTHWVHMHCYHPSLTHSQI